MKPRRSVVEVQGPRIRSDVGRWTLDQRAHTALCMAVCLLAMWCASACLGEEEASSQFAAIDAVAQNAPESAAATVSSLAAYLTKSAKTDLEKARSIYEWLITHVDYDIESLLAGTYGKQTADQVLKSRKGVCGEYSALFDALCKQAKLESQTLFGFSRGPGFSVDNKLEPEPDHAWSVVKIDGKWQLLDVTWAAGYIDADNKFVRKAFDHYFLTAADQFVYDHFPEEDKWQLLAKPITKDDFVKLVYLRPGFFRNKLQVVSNKERDIEAPGTLAITFGGPSDVMLNAEVARGRDRDSASQTFVQRESDLLKINTLIPKTGKYTLRIYAKRPGSGTRFEWAADYAVKVTKGAGAQASLPKMFSTFQERNAVLFAPLTGTLKSQQAASFKISAPGAESVDLVIGGQWTKLAKSGDTFEGQAEVSGQVVQVVAKYPDNESSYVLLKYDVAG